MNVSVRTAQTIHLQLAVVELCAGKRAASGGPRGEQVVEQVRAPVADAEGLALGRACARENQLPAVVAFAGLDPVDQAAIQETVDPDDERILPLGPQRRVLLTARELDLPDACRGYSARSRCLCAGRRLRQHGR